MTGTYERRSQNSFLGIRESLKLFSFAPLNTDFRVLVYSTHSITYEEHDIEMLLNVLKLIWSGAMKVFKKCSNWAALYSLRVSGADLEHSLFKSSERVLLSEHMKKILLGRSLDGPIRTLESILTIKMGVDLKGEDDSFICYYFVGNLKNIASELGNIILVLLLLNLSIYYWYLTVIHVFYLNMIIDILIRISYWLCTRYL